MLSFNNSIIDGVVAVANVQLALMFLLTSHDFIQWNNAFCLNLLIAFYPA